MKTAEEMRRVATSKNDEYDTMEHDRVMREIEGKIESAAALGHTGTHISLSSYYMDKVIDELTEAGYQVKKLSMYVWKISW